MIQNAQTNEQNPNKTHKQSNETQANPHKKKKNKKTKQKKNKTKQMKPTSQSLYGFRFSRNREIERSTKKRKVRVMNLCCCEK